MSDHTNPQAPVIANPINLDKAITNIQLKLATIPWLAISYGRVYQRATKELTETGAREEPHVYAGNGQYKKVLANDNFQSHSFIYVIPPERIVDYELNQNAQNKEVDIAIIFWLDLRKIDPTTDEIYLEQLKSDIEAKLYSCPDITEVSRIYDDNADDIFREFDTRNLSKELLMYPYKALRYECQIMYETFCQ